MPAIYWKIYGDLLNLLVKYEEMFMGTLGQCDTEQHSLAITWELLQTLSITQSNSVEF